MTSPSIHIRIAGPDDCSAIQALISASARQLTGGDYAGVAVESALRSGALGLDARLIEDGVFYLAFVEGRLAACGGWSFRASLSNGDRGAPREDLLDPDRDAAKIRGLYTHPEFAGRGLGALLLACCETAAQLAGFSSFELAATPAGERLYRRKGYIASHSIDYEVGCGLTMRALIMKKDLARPDEIAAPPSGLIAA
ncbi:MAG: GNAT family N-acetyltransferase [Pseudomonadota bacterium]